MSDTVLSIDAASLRAQLAKICRDSRVPGMVVSVHGPAERLNLALGHRDVQTSERLDTGASFELGCVAKPLLAIAAIRLARHGKLGLDDPIGRYLPEVASTVHGRSVRVSHLLSHTSGYRGTGMLEVREGLDWLALVSHLRRAPQHFSPGVVFSYEHSETALLGRVLAVCSGHSPEALIESLVLEPSGVGADGVASAGRHGLDPSGRLERLPEPRRGPTFWQPGFALALSMPGVARVTRKLLGSVDGRRSDRRSLLGSMLEGGVALPPMIAGPACPELPVGFARGIARYRGGWFGASGMGAGQCVALRCHPGRGLVVALAVNVLAPALRDALIAALCRDCVPESPSAAPEMAAPLDAFAGDYVGGGDGFVRARRSGGSLDLEIGSQRATGRLRARLVRGAGGRVALDADVPHLAVGLAAPPRKDPWLMLGLTAFKRISVSGPSCEISAFPAGAD